MKFRLTPETHAVEDTFQMAAMVDIVFILLALFVMATRFHQPEHDLDMGYSKAAVGGQSGVEDLPSTIPIQLRQIPGGVAIRLGQARTSLVRRGGSGQAANIHLRGRTLHCR